MVIYIVIILSILIIFSFIALIYGIYSKLSDTSFKEHIPSYTYLKLNDEQNIIDFEVIDNSRILIKIKDENSIYMAIYDIDKKQILEYIKK